MASIFDLFKKLEKDKSRSDTGPVSWLLVGLGNPGSSYRTTRHNTGFLLLESIAGVHAVSITRSRFQALTADAELFGQRVLFMLPQTFMNASGDAVSAAAGYYKIDPQHVLVLCDDINLPFGKVRIRAGGSDGGQRGLRSIINRLDSDRFPRIRIGIGEKPNPDYDLKDWVLSHYTAGELERLQKLTAPLDRAVSLILDSQIETAMQECNGIQV
ncbi:MAG: aminoacyl-tRNA hydrolase [Clostridia bacterium]|nr:aminoacyl-tRNA hydrolase [Clostridia bacterium]